MGSQSLVEVPRREWALTEKAKPMAALSGGLGTGSAVLLGVGLFGVLAQSGWLQFSSILTWLLACVSFPVLASFPAALAGRALTRRFLRSSLEEGQAAAAGAGIASFIVGLGSLMMLPSAWHHLGFLAPLAVGVTTAAGFVGHQAFAPIRALRQNGEEETPPLYLASISAGVSAIHLTFWSGFLTAVLSSFYPAFFGTIPGQISQPFAAFVATALCYASLSPVTLFSTQFLARRYPHGSRAFLALGVGLPLLTPGLVTLSLLLETMSYATLAKYWLLSSIGLAVGCLPHLLAIHLGLGLVTRAQRDRKLPAPEPAKELPGAPEAPETA